MGRHDRNGTGTAQEKRTNLHLAIANEVGADIVAGRLPVGSVIPSETELCLQFGVSRTVVREAVKLLASKGLLKSGSGIGTWVLPASEWNSLDPAIFSLLKESDGAEAMLRHLFTFRSAVEPAAAAEAARSATLEQLYTIEAALRTMEQAKDNFAEWLEGDVAFHTALYVASNNVFLAPLANLFRAYFQMSFSVSSSNVHHQHCLQEHRDVFEAIRSHDEAGAAEAVRILLERANEDARAVMAVRSAASARSAESAS